MFRVGAVGMGIDVIHVTKFSNNYPYMELFLHDLIACTEVIQNDLAVTAL